ncbi:hypothetical protein [uncultured Ramlibacter sp.]|uniref:hypothetical protein n=1 Tax=uncultured Ramlibacter sp. TaxID=260755 RepID=UPI0026142BD9|nr:hypothetical protein [uncultured Ramlibacter sp.]
MTRLPHPDRKLLCACLAAAGLLAACGGSDDPAAPAAPAATTTTVSGAVVKGPVNGANVCAYKATAAGKGEQLKCVSSGAAGSYSMDLDYVGDIVVEASGGSYTDEATNTSKTLSDPMQVVLASQGGATTGVITPLTSAAFSVAKTASGGVSSASFATAAGSVASQFQLSGVNLATTVPTVTGTTNAYGQILRAVSQYVANGNSLGSVLTLSSPTALQGGFGTAYATINGTSLTFTFNGATTGGTGGTVGTGGTGGTGTGGTAGNKTLVITVGVAGTTSTVTIPNVPQPTTQTEFCDGLANDTQFKQLAAGGTFTINSCSYSGNTGNIAASISASGFNVAYTIKYAYQ